MMRRTTAVAAFVAAVVTVVDAQQPRDGRAPAPGTAAISGVVVAADSMSPIRRAIVEAGDRRVLTDDEGRFEFTRLPAGGYGVVANKAGYLPAAFGAKRVAGPGVAVDVGDGRHASGIELKLFRGSVLTGTVSDQTSRPVADAVIRAYRYGFDADTGQLMPLPPAHGLAETITDDKGRYRLYGLEPGDYIVSTSPAAPAAAIRIVTEADLRYAQGLLRLPFGTPPDSSIRRPPAVVAPAQSSGAPVFYLSGESIAEAVKVTIGIAEERPGVDLARRRVAAGLVKGSVFGSYQAIRDGGKVHLIDTASPLIETVPWDPVYGSFMFTGVAPGRYDIVALSNTGGRIARAEAYVVAGNEVAMALQLRPGSTISGRLVFRSAAGQPADPSLVRLALNAATRADFPLGAAPANADGSFSWTNAPAGKYRLSVTTAPNLQPGWRVTSAVLNGVELLDSVLEVAGTNVGEIVVTLSDARSEIAGTLQAATGAPVSDYSVLVFSADNQHWRPASRRTNIVRPNSSGRFGVRDLPEGEYLIVALADIEPGQWHNRDFLAELAPFALKVSLADGEKKTQDIRISGGLQ